MAELKTTPNAASVDAFLETIQDEQRRLDCYTVLKLMKQVTNADPKMWGSSIVGFGSIHLAYESGRELDWFLCGFSPRKANLTLYIMAGFSKYPELLAVLGKVKTGKSCLYINRLSEVNLDILKKLLAQSVAHLRKSTR